jgi:hypothetical protein
MARADDRVSGRHTLAHEDSRPLDRVSDRHTLARMQMTRAILLNDPGAFPIRA